MPELIQRCITGTAYVGVIVLAALLGHSVMTAILLLITILGCSELSKLLNLDNTETALLTPMVIVTFLGTVMSIFIDLGDFIFIPFAVISALTVIFAAAGKIGIVFGMIYLAFPMALLVFLGVPDYRFENGEWHTTEMGSTDLILIFFILMWTYDSLAYTCGRLFGKNKLAPQISPGKTWEGLLGGLLFTCIAGYFLGDMFNVSRDLTLLMAPAIAIFGTIGDLLESSLKRSAEVKDSGTLLPGHGGILDRIDGILIASPVVISLVYIYNLAVA